jgi:hypothetical protein
MIATGPHPQAQGVLGCDEQIYDIGHVGIDFSVYHDFKLFNTGNRPIKLDSVQVSCECSRLQISDSTVRPGDTVRLHLTFDTRNWYGPTSKMVVVLSNDAKQPRLELYYKSVVGQWPAGLKPEPISVFMLPGQKARKLIMVNSQFKKYTLSVDTPVDTFYTVTISKPEVSRGNATEIDVKAGDNLKNGTYLSSFRVRAQTAELPEPIYLTVPVKIVRY